MFIMLSCNIKGKKHEQSFIDTEKNSIAHEDNNSILYPNVSMSSSDSTSAGSKIIFKVEELQRPDFILKEDSLRAILENIIKVQYLKKRWFFEDSIQIGYNIISHYNKENKLVNYGNRSFFWGMHKAYADHRPFILSPDIIWLLISQGFANHVNNNSEELRNLFVNFDNKALLTVHYDLRYDQIDDFTWENIFSEFPKQIAHFTGKELINILSSDFSTTASLNKTISEITIMSAFESYFTYNAGTVVCGIPEITVEGTPEDWQKVYDKTQYIKNYKLDWWIKELEPVLKEFIKTSKGKINRKFWKNMFKVHEAEMCGDPDIVDGWIVKFFPYFADGKRSNLKTITLDTDMPSEIVKVNLDYYYSDGTKEIITPLEIWAGFFGLQQDTKTCALKPDIGWMVRKRDKENPVFKYYFDTEKPNKIIAFKTSVVPDEFLKIKEANWVIIDFTDKIIIPDKMAKMKIKQLILSGKISDEGINRICSMFPDTYLEINNKEYNIKNKEATIW